MSSKKYSKWSCYLYNDCSFSFGAFSSTILGLEGN